MVPGPRPARAARQHRRSEEHTSELQSQSNLVCRLLLEKKKNTKYLRQPFQAHTALGEAPLPLSAPVEIDLVVYHSRDARPITTNLLSFTIFRSPPLVCD